MGRFVCAVVVDAGMIVGWSLGRVVGKDTWAAARFHMFWTKMGGARP